jgi:hypothetical protein
MSGPVWLYRPAHHKTRHKGKQRVVAIGPKGQAVIKPFLKLNTQAYLFSPRDALAALRARQRAQRKTKVQPSQRGRKKQKPQKEPGERYHTTSYAHAVVKAVLAANKAQSCETCKPLKSRDRCDKCKGAAIPHWHPHQVRHTHATEVRRRFGLEAAPGSLGTFAGANYRGICRTRHETRGKGGDRDRVVDDTGRPFKRRGRPACVWIPTLPGIVITNQRSARES